MSILIWAMVGIAVWHFAVLVPDRFWGGIIGAFLAALLGASRIRVRAADSRHPARQSAGVERGAVAAAGLASRPRRLVPVRGPKGAHRRRGSLKAVQRRLDRHVRLRPGCGVAVEFVAAEQIWGEIPPRDLARRPPERLFRTSPASCSPASLRRGSGRGRRSSACHGARAESGWAPLGRRQPQRSTRRPRQPAGRRGRPA